MGMIIDGQWQEQDQFMKNGEFVRAMTSFNNALPQSVLEKISGNSGRYILIASNSCPWSHRTLLVRAIKNLQDILPVHMAGGPRLQGYGLVQSGPLAACLDPLPKHLHQLYTMADKNFTGRATVPVLWDTKDKKIISNDSVAIMAGLDLVDTETVFTLSPDHLKTKITCLNNEIHDNLSNAVYRAGLAQKQDAYDQAVDQVFAMLDKLDQRLENQRCLFDNLLTQADLRLFATLVRFDAVYATHFRCTRKRLVDYPYLWGYTRDIYALPGISKTIDFPVILDGYYINDGDHNPHGIIADLPETDWRADPTREELGPLSVWNSQLKSAQNYLGA